MKKLSLALILAVVVSLACESDDPTQPPPETVYIMPLGQGADWSGTLLIDDGDIERQWSRFVSGDTLINNQTWYWISTTENGDTSWNAWLYRNDEEGLWWRRVGVDPRLAARYPGAIGDTFGLDPDDDSYMEIMSTDTAVTVPAGTFQCYHYHFYPVNNGDATNADFFYAPGAGMVYSHAPAENFWVNSFTYILEDYQLPGE